MIGSVDKSEGLQKLLAITFIKRKNSLMESQHIPSVDIYLSSSFSEYVCHETDCNTFILVENEFCHCS